MRDLTTFLRKDDSPAVHRLLRRSRQKPQAGQQAMAEAVMKAKVWSLRRQVLDLAEKVAGLEENSGPGLDASTRETVVGGGSFVNNKAFGFVQTSDTGGTVNTGLCYIGGVAKTVTSLPTTLTGVTTTTKYWIAVELATATATWNSGATYPASDSDTEVWPILELTCTAGIISAVHQCWDGDVHVTLTP